MKIRRKYWNIWVITIPYIIMLLLCTVIDSNKEMDILLISVMISTIVYFMVIYDEYHKIKNLPIDVYQYIFYILMIVPGINIVITTTGIFVLSLFFIIDYIKKFTDKNIID